MSNFKINKPMHAFLKISGTVFLLIITLFVACKKDLSSTVTYTTKQRIEGPVSVEEAKYTFDNSRLTRANDREYEITIDSITPLWDAAINSEYANTADILIVPIAPDSNRLPGGGGNLVFFRTQDSLLDYRLLVHVPDSTYWDTSGHKLNTHTFTGAIVLVEPGGTVGDAFFFSGGTFIGTDDGEVAETVAPDGGCDDPNPDPGCYKFGPSFWSKIGNFFSNIWAGLGNIFGGSGGSGGGGGNNTILNWGGAFSGIYPSYNYDPNSNGGSSGPAKLSDYFDVTLLEGIERKNAIEINKFKDKYCLYAPAAEILNQLTAKCDFSDDPNELFGQIKENLYASIAILPQCVKDVIVQDRYNLLTDGYGLTITPTEFNEIASDDCLLTSECDNQFDCPENGNNLGIVTLCIVANNLIKLSDPEVDAYYVKFLNLLIGFFHTTTGANVTVTFPELCIQTHDGFSKAFTVNQIKLAFISAVMNTEAAMNRGELLPISALIQTYMINSFNSTLDLSLGGGCTATGQGGCRGDIAGIPGQTGC